MNLAAVGSSKNFGRGSSALGTSPAKIGTRLGASSQSQSMIRSKNVRMLPRLWRMVALDIAPFCPGLEAKASLNPSMWARPMSATATQPGSVAVT